MEDESLSGSLQHPHHLHHHHLQNSSHHIQHRHVSPSVCDDGVEEEELDPRIQIELEKLNRATEEINRLELELDDARASFRQVLSDSSQRLNGLAKKLGTSVDKARPYYDVRMKLKEAHLESQKAALRFERACSMHEAAKEMVQLAEEGYKRREEDLDPTWQEMLNHATMKVNDAERERIESEDHHQSTTLNFKKKEEEVQKLQRDLKRAITKSKPYFEMKAKFNQVMEDHKRNVSRLEEDVASTKALYSEALRNLEAISDDIHRQRLERRQKMQLGIRGAGVGAESPSPPPLWDKGINIDGSASHVLNNDGDDRACKKRWKEQGIVGFDLPLCHQSSVSDDHDIDSLKSDPLNLVVFKTDSHQHAHPPTSSSYDNNNFHPPSVIRDDPRYARNHSYRQAMDKDDNGNELAHSRVHDANTDNNLDSQVINNNTSSVHTPTTPTTAPSSSSKSHQLRREMEAMQSSLSRAQEWVNKSPVPQQRRFIKSKSLIDAASASATSSPSSSPSSSSTMLSSSAAGNNNSKSSFDTSVLPHPAVTLTSSLTTDAMKVMASNARLREENDTPAKQPSPPIQSSNTNTKVSSALSARLLQQQQESSPSSSSLPLPPPPPPTLPTTKITDKNDSISIQIQPHLQQPLQQATPSPPLSHPQHHHHHQHPHHHLHHPQSSPRSFSSTTTTSDQSSPNSGSPSGKSPKLQGLILRVDAAGIMASPSPTSSSSATNHPYSKHNNNNQVVITTKTPSLGVQVQNTAAEQQQQQLHQHGGVTTPSSSSILLSTSSSQKSPLSSSLSSPSPSSHTNPSSDGVIVSSPIASATISVASPPRPTLIPYTRSSSLSLGGFKLPVSITSSKAPQTSTAFHLPSPTQPRSTSLSIPPPLAIRQMISPTPPSPSGDRVSVLSGRSDSSKGGLLRPPSDSSDTESIASTGPMLDDDQVEFLTMDFTEQSISSSAPQEEPEEGDMSDLDPSRLQRGNWSRMSLPPRLSYLGGYLERTRHAVASSPNDTSGVVGVEYNNNDGGRRSGGDNENNNDGGGCDSLSPQGSGSDGGVGGGAREKDVEEDVTVVDEEGDRDGDGSGCGVVVEGMEEEDDEDAAGAGGEELVLAEEEDDDGGVVVGDDGECEVSVSVKIDLDDVVDEERNEDEQDELVVEEVVDSGSLYQAEVVEATIVVTKEGLVEVTDGVEDSTES